MENAKQPTRGEIEISRFFAENTLANIQRIELRFRTVNEKLSFIEGINRQIAYINFNFFKLFTKRQRAELQIIANYTSTRTEEYREQRIVQLLHKELLKITGIDKEFYTVKYIEEQIKRIEKLLIGQGEGNDWEDSLSPHYNFLNEKIDKTGKPDYTKPFILEVIAYRRVLEILRKEKADLEKQKTKTLSWQKSNDIKKPNEQANEETKHRPQTIIKYGKIRKEYSYLTQTKKLRHNKAIEKIREKFDSCSERTVERALK